MKLSNIFDDQNCRNMDIILKEGLQKNICIALMISSVVNKTQKFLMEKLVDNNPKYVGIVFNMTGIKLYYQGRKLILGGEQSITNAIKTALGLSKHIVIFAGYTASRGISFTDPEHKYHLTDLYLRTNETLSGHCEQLIQKLRVLGIYDSEDDIYKTAAENKLNIWCIDKLRDEICKCYRTIKILTEKLVEDIEKAKK